MTDESRVRLGSVNPTTMDKRVGRVLYDPAEMRLFVPLARRGENYWSDILVDLSSDGPAIAHRDLSVEYVQAAKPDINPSTPDSLFILWLARVAAALWTERESWYVIRTVALEGRVPGGGDIVLDRTVTKRVCEATHTRPDRVMVVLTELAERGFLVKQAGGHPPQDLGEWRTEIPTLDRPEVSAAGTTPGAEDAPEIQG